MREFHRCMRLIWQLSMKGAVIGDWKWANQMLLQLDLQLGQDREKSEALVSSLALSFDEKMLGIPDLANAKANTWPTLPAPLSSSDRSD